MARYIPIGSPINRAETEGLRLLRDRLPDTYTLIGNFELQLPKRRNTLEFDAVLIGDWGVYAVEIKGWSGQIEGDIRRWQLGWNRVESPFIRTETKAKALRDLLARHLPSWPEHLYCESIVYLPSPNTQVTLRDPRGARLVLRDDERGFFVERAARMAHQDTRPHVLDESLRRQIEALLVPISRPTDALPRIPNYVVEESLSRPHLPYAEFVARHQLLRSRGRVRIKSYRLDPLLAPHCRDEVMASTLSDIEALNTLEEIPYVARAYELIRDVEDELVLHVVSEWLGQKTLKDHLSSLQGAIHTTSHAEQLARWKLAYHLVRAVSMLHAHKVTHRNLHPGLIYLTAEGTVPFKIADFDFARVGRVDGHDEALRDVIKQGYGAPEMWLGAHPHDHRVDVYSLGAILFELFAGRPLYGDDTDLMRHDEIWMLHRTAIKDTACRTLLDHLLAYRPQDRLEDVRPLLDFFVKRVRHSSLAMETESQEQPSYG